MERDKVGRKMTLGRSVRAMEKEEEYSVPPKSQMRTFKAMEEEGAELMPTLPQEMVEKIIAMVPFPFIYKAVCLSKSWRARFSSISLLEDVEKECAAAFQKQIIGEGAKNWDTFCPVFVGMDHLVAYCQKSRNWKRISLSFLPELLPIQSRRYVGVCPDSHDAPLSYYLRFQNTVHKLSVSFDDLQINGALLSICHQSKWYVADILTQRWKQLPPRPQEDQSIVVCSKVVSNMFLGTYKVVLFCQDYCPDYCRHSHDHFSAHIYESNSRTWSTQHFSITTHFCVKRGFTFRREGAWTVAYLNGVLYMVPFRIVQHLLAFNLAAGTLEELKFSFNYPFIDRADRLQFDSVNLLVCNDNRLMMVTRGRLADRVQILRVDLQSLRLMLVYRGLPACSRLQTLPPRLAPKASPKPVSDGNCIFFCTFQPGLYEKGRDQILAYNLKEQAWSAIPFPATLGLLDHKTYRWIGSAFQPSLSAFVAL